MLGINSKSLTQSPDQRSFSYPAYLVELRMAKDLAQLKKRLAELEGRVAS